MEPDLWKELKPDCASCRGLCCVALFFAKTDGFPYNKKAGVPCRNLRPDFRCTLHPRLSELGLKGCLAYDCFGAGPKVTRIYGEKNWKNVPGQAQEMFAAFLAVRQLCQMLWYLLEAQRMLPAEGVQSLIRQNEDITMQCPEKILSFDIPQYRMRVNAALKNAAGATGGKPMGKDCIGKNFWGQNLDGTDFSMALLIAANLEECSLRGANFLGADLRDCNLKNADLGTGIFLTQGQVNAAKGNARTKLPPWIDIPASWKKSL